MRNPRKSIYTKINLLKGFTIWASFDVALVYLPLILKKFYIPVSTLTKCFFPLEHALVKWVTTQQEKSCLKSITKTTNIFCLLVMVILIEIVNYENFSRKVLKNLKFSSSKLFFHMSEWNFHLKTEKKKHQLYFITVKITSKTIKFSKNFALSIFFKKSFYKSILICHR